MQLSNRSVCRLLLIVTGLLALHAVARAQQQTSTKQPYRGEVGLEYTFMRSNAPPGGCGCFNLNGGSANVAWHLKADRFALVADATVATSSSIPGSQYNVTLGTYTAGIRYQPHFKYKSLRPFGEVLAGVAHAGGSLVNSSTYTVPNAAAAFAGNVGGGIDLALKSRFSIRLIEADYLATTFQNGDSNHQNNLRLSTGLIVHF